MSKIPDDMPQLSCGLFYDDPIAALTWLERAFGFQLRLKVMGDDGVLVHSELQYGAGVVMVNAASRHGGRPTAKDGSPVYVMLYVEDVDAHHRTAVAGGATITAEPTTAPYGDRGYGARDLEGHSWWFVQRVDQPAYTAAIADARAK